MATDQNSHKKVNFLWVQKFLNFISFFSIIIASIVIIIIFLIGYFQLKFQNSILIEEKNEQVFKIYSNGIFQKILLLSNSTTFLDYLRSGLHSRKKLENEILNHFSHYINDEIVGYKVDDLSLNEIFFVGEKTDSFLLLKLCYLNDKLNYNLGRCAANMYVYFDKKLAFKQIQKIEPSAIYCTQCKIFNLNSGYILNDIYILDSHNFNFSFSVKLDDYTNILLYILLSLMIMVLFGCLSFYLNRKYLYYYIYQPLENLFSYVNNESCTGPFILDEISIIVKKIYELKNKIKLNEKVKREDELIKLAQIAHDIRSPLVALNTFFSKSSQLSEENRIIVRNLIQRMQDIANNLLLQHKEILNSDLNDAVHIREPHSIQLMSSLVESLISEKRLQYRDNLNIEIEENITENSYGLFAKIQPKEFKRALSNLINNAVESFNDKGKVVVELNSLNDGIFLIIRDNGRGIHPDIYPKLMEKGATFNKKGGSGLGLYHAKNLAKLWGGNLELFSQYDKGTAVHLKLPKSLPPNWFVPCIYIKENMTIIIVDDDASIHNIWDDRLKQIKNNLNHLNILHFSNPTSLIYWVTNLKFCETNNFLFLCDYEFINYSVNGIELILKLNIVKQSILITSRFEDDGFAENCLKNSIRMIPKCLTCFVPIKIVNEEVKNLIKEKFDGIIIDDDLFVHQLWQMYGKDKKLFFYEDPFLFLQNSQNYDTSSPIYIDSNLKNGIKGEEISKEIFDLGFKDITLCTGHHPSYFTQEMKWIKKIQGKEPPW